MAHQQATLPDIETIVRRRIKAGIASSIEHDLYYGNDLVEEEYSDESKRQLLAELDEYRRGHRQSPTYWELLTCTNEVIRAVLPLQLQLRNGNHPGFTIERSELNAAAKILRTNRKLFRETFGARKVHEARALLWIIRRDIQGATAVSYMKRPDAFVASLD